MISLNTRQFPPLFPAGNSALRRSNFVGSGSLFVPCILVLLLSGTLPGIYFISEWLGKGVLKAAGILLIIFFATDEIRLLTLRRVQFLLIGLIGLGLYCRINSVIVDVELIEFVSSFLWLFLLGAALSRKNRIVPFSAMITIPLSFVVLSAGVERIFDFSRRLDNVLREDSLVGVASHYINYSMCCIIVIFVGSVLFLILKQWLIKGLFGFLAATAFIGALTSGSRGGIIAVMSGGLFFLYAIRKKICGQRIISHIAVILFVVLVSFAFPWEMVYECFTVDDFSTGSMGDRWYLYTSGLKIAKEHLLFGVGWGGFRSVIGTAQHSNLLRTLVELGLIGVIFELGLWLMFFNMAFFAQKISEKLEDRNLSLIIIAWISTMVSYFVWEAFENIGLLTGTRLFYICFGVVLAGYASVKIRETVRPIDLQRQHLGRIRFNKAQKLQTMKKREAIHR